MTPLKCTQQGLGPSPQAWHQLHFAPNHNLTPSSLIHLPLYPIQPPQEINSGANWTNIMMSPDYPDPNEILDEIRSRNKPTY